jgi:nitroreductase
MREALPSKVEAALHMLRCRIDAATLSPSSHAIESWRSRKIAFVPRLEWL